jgi:anti-sigma B factor antagonist
LTVTEEHHGKVTILRLAGGFVGRANVSLFERAIFDHLKKDVLWIVLDLAELKHVDSAGLGAMISAMVSVGRKGGGLKLAAASGDVQRIIKNMHLDQVFDIHSTVQRAEASIGN